MVLKMAFLLSSAYGGDICITSDGQIYLSGIDGVVSFIRKRSETGI